MVLIREALTHESDIHQKNTESDIDQRGIETRKILIISEENLEPCLYFTNYTTLFVKH